MKNFCPFLRDYCKSNCMMWERIPDKEIESMPEEEKPHPKNSGRCGLLTAIRDLAKSKKGGGR
jgi:hypothetical protein